MYGPASCFRPRQARRARGARPPARPPAHPTSTHPPARPPSRPPARPSAPPAHPPAHPPARPRTRPPAGHPSCAPRRAAGRLKLLDKEYAEWLKAVAAHPAKADASGGTTPLPYAIDWAAFWAEWTTRVEGAAATSAGVGVDELMQPDTQPVRSLVLAVLEAGRRPRRRLGRAARARGQSRRARRTRQRGAGYTRSSSRRSRRCTTCRSTPRRVARQLVLGVGL